MWMGVMGDDVEGEVGDSPLRWLTEAYKWISCLLLEELAGAH